jgi:hypothetical protein
MDNEQLVSWHENQPILKVLDNVGCDGGATNITTARIACRRAAQRIRELELELDAYDKVARRLICQVTHVADG